jgi:N-methylhydantoinase A/oxoprolinase/acetone carboxylase beta subunit
MVDLIEIGAGGGSIASCNSLGILAVGPQSTGSVPGPACYGRGGTLPTVSDANLLLGYLDPGNFLGGEMPLDAGAAREAFGPLAARMGKPVVEIAWAIQETVNQNMVRAAQLHAFDTARDLSDYTLVVSGGCAPAHACRLARELGIRKVVVPMAAGVASSLGFLVAPVSIDLRRTVLMPLSRMDPAVIAQACDSMRAEALGALADVGVAEDKAEVALSIEARFVGQAHSLALGIDVAHLGDANRLAEAFKDKYRQSYGDCPSRADVEITAVRMQMLQRAEVRGAVTREAVGGKRRANTRIAYFPETGETRTPVHDRDSLAAGERIEGPAILQERDTTTIIPPGAVAEVDPSGNLIIDLAGMELTA